jgi:hypothetical protein
MPCTTYKWTRDCSQTFFFETINATTIGNFKNLYDCVAACLGVSYMSWSYIMESYWFSKWGTSWGNDTAGFETSPTSSNSASATNSTSKPPTALKEAASTTATSVSVSGSSSSTNSASPASQTKSAGSHALANFSVLFAGVAGYFTLLSIL